MNQVFIEGNVASIKMNEKGNFMSFSLAENISFKKKDGSEVKETHWYGVVAHNGTAKFIERNVVQGDKILVHGHLTTSTYEKDGSKITTLQIVANEVRIMFHKNADK